MQKSSNQSGINKKKTPIANENSNIRYLFIDGLNYLDRFFKEPDFWNYGKAFKEVKKFIQAAQKAKRHTQETQQKWRTRREKEIQSCSRNKPICLTNLYGDFWREQGIKVHFSDVDNDDTLASYAQHFNADVLSADKDFHRYIGRKYKVYNNYQIHKDGCLYLQKAKAFKHDEPRDLIFPLPITYQQFHTIPRLFQHKFYIKGASTPLVQYTGNLYMLIQPFRQAFYALLDVDFAVKEIFPSWDKEKQKVYWIEQYVEKSQPKQLSFFIQILLSEDDIYLLLYHFSSAIIKPADWKRYDESIWRNHLYCFCGVISELLAYINLQPIKYYLDKGRDFIFFLDRHLNQIQDNNEIMKPIEKSKKQDHFVLEEDEADGWQVTSTNRQKSRKQIPQKQKTIDDSQFNVKLTKIKEFLQKLEDPLYHMSEEDISEYVRLKSKQYSSYLDQRNYGNQEILKSYNRKIDDDQLDSNDIKFKTKDQKIEEEEKKQYYSDEDEEGGDFWDDI